MDVDSLLSRGNVALMTRCVTTVERSDEWRAKVGLPVCDSKEGVSITSNNNRSQRSSAEKGDVHIMKSVCGFRISVNNFMRYLFASLAKEKNIIIDKSKIVKKIYDFKSGCTPDQMYIFNDIEFRTCVDHIVSYDIDEGINNLQTFGVVSKLNPIYEKIVVNLTEQKADTILNCCEQGVREFMRQLAVSFNR